MAVESADKSDKLINQTCQFGSWIPKHSLIRGEIPSLEFFTRHRSGAQIEGKGSTGVRGSYFKPSANSEIVRFPCLDVYSSPFNCKQNMTHRGGWWPSCIWFFSSSRVRVERSTVNGSLETFVEYFLWGKSLHVGLHIVDSFFKRHT